MSLLLALGDAWAPPNAQSRRVAAYQGSYSLNVAAAAVPFDAVALGCSSRPVAAYRAPLSKSISVYDQPAAPPSSTDFTPGVASRPTPAYRGSASSVSNAADQDPGRMSFVSVSRAQAPRPVSLSQAINVFDNPTATPTDSWVSAIASRSGARNYQGSYSLTIASAAVPFDTFVAGINSRPQSLYRGSASSVSNAADQDPGTMAFVSQNRPVACYLAPRSSTITVYSGTSDTWAASYQSRASANYRAPLSQTIAGLLGVVVPDGWAATYQSRQLFNVLPIRSIALWIADFFPATAGGGGGGRFGGEPVDPFANPFASPFASPFADPFAATVFAQPFTDPFRKAPKGRKKTP